MKTIAYYQHDKADASDGLTGEKSRGVQAIVQDHPQVGREIVTGGDYYIRREGRWYPVDVNGLFDWLLDCPDVAFGRMISGEEYDKVMTNLNKDKHGWTAKERKK